jgi:hypothetical protein
MAEKVSIMRRFGESLARAIKGYDSFSYVAGAMAPDLQVFLWAGYRVELVYTFRFEAAIAVDQILQGMTRQHRQNLAKAQQQMTVEVGGNIDILMDLNRQTFSRQGLPLPYQESLPRHLWAAARSRGLADIYLARTAEGAAVAGVLVVHDRCNTCQIVSGMDSETRSSAGGYLVAWQAIQDAILAGRAFDFEGSSLRGVERYYRHWGAAAKPIWRLERAGTLRGALVRAMARRLERRDNSVF